MDEVVEDEGKGWVRVLVRRSEILTAKYRQRLSPLPSGTEVRRERTTIARGNPERMAWSDESAGGALLSQFLGKR